MAQLVERVLGKDEVGGSNPPSSSKNPWFSRVFFIVKIALAHKSVPMKKSCATKPFFDENRDNFFIFSNKRKNALKRRYFYALAHAWHTNLPLAHVSIRPKKARWIAGVIEKLTKLFRCSMKAAVRKVLFVFICYAFTKKVKYCLKIGLKKGIVLWYNNY